MTKRKHDVLLSEVKNKKPVRKRATSSKKPKPFGRPKIELTNEEKLKLLYLASADCPVETIRMILKLSNDAFYRLMKEPDVLEVFNKGQSLRNTRIKMKQLEVAMEGNAQMLIHLGKNYLGQDKSDTQVVTEVNQFFDKDSLIRIAKVIADEKD